MAHRMSRNALVGVALGCAALGFVAGGIVQREHNIALLQKEAEEAATPKVQLISPHKGPARRQLSLPGNIEAWYEAPIYAQVSGYVKMWYKDYGANVRAGDLLAQVSTPELDAQYAAALARLKVEQTRYRLADVTAARWRALAGTQAVSRQEVDVQSANALVQKAEVESAQHEVARYRALQGFKNIVAPFDGVVTARFTNVGDYVSPGGGDLGAKGRASALFQVSDIHKLRVFVDVPQDYATILVDGLSAEISAPQYPGKMFKVRYLTTARAFNKVTRTVTTEFVVDNPHKQLWPGTFVTVHFNAPADSAILLLPESSIIFRAQGTQVALVDESNRVRLRSVRLGLSLGKEVQVLSGLSAGDQVINNPTAGLMEGQEVRVVDGAPGYMHPQDRTDRDDNTPPQAQKDIPAAADRDEDIGDKP